jgi:hypothetical protein
MDWRKEIDQSRVFITLSSPDFLMTDDNLLKLAYAMASDKPILVFLSEPNFLPSGVKDAKVIRYVNIDPKDLTLEVFEAEVYKFLHDLTCNQLENDNILN